MTNMHAWFIVNMYTVALDLSWHIAMVYGDQYSLIAHTGGVWKGYIGSIQQT